MSSRVKLGTAPSTFGFQEVLNSEEEGRALGSRMID